MTDQQQRFLVRVQAYPRQRIPVETLWADFDAIYPEYRDAPNRRSLLLEVLEACAAAGRIELPRGKNHWQGQGQRRLPLWVKKPSPARPASTSSGESVSWLPGLAFGANLRGRPRADLAQINAFLIQRGADLAPVPFRERALEIFGDEHYWDSHNQLDATEETLFKGRLPLARLGAFVVPDPLAYEPVEGLHRRPVLVAENHHSYHSLAEWNRTSRTYCAVAYGQGNAVWAKVRELAALAARMDAGHVEYVGDIDRGGLWIPHILGTKLLQVGSLQLRPAMPFYRWLIEHGRVVSASVKKEDKEKEKEERRDWQGSLSWFKEDPPLQQRAYQLLAGEQRIAQEALGTEQLTAGSWHRV